MNNRALNFRNGSGQFSFNNPENGIDAFALKQDEGRAFQLAGAPNTSPSSEFKQLIHGPELI